MDGKWTFPVLPTAFPGDEKAVTDKFIEIFPEFKKTKDNEFNVEQVRGLTTQLIRRHPHNPATWTSRAYNLLRLGYPDLAVGDAFKAIMLLDIWASPGSELGPTIAKELWRETKHGISLQSNKANLLRDRSSRIRAYSEHIKDRAFMILAQALFFANCYIECFEVLKDYSSKRSVSKKFHELKELAERAQMIENLSRLQDDEFVRNNDPVSQEIQRSGSIIPQIYPWSAPFVQRGDIVSTVASSNVSMASNYKCSLGHSSIADGIVNTNLAEKEADTLGIVANTDFDEGALLLVDRTFLSGVDDPRGRCSCCRGLFDKQYITSKANCCDTLFCSDGCTALARNYHYAVCGKNQDLNQLPQLCLDHSNVSADSKALNSLLFRLIAHIEQKPGIHPLRTPTVGAMIPAYRNTSPISFSLLNDIKRPLAMLVLLGVDVFKDHALDTWVIQTMQARLRNNVRDYTDESENYHVSINLSYMFFNHSCEPNVKIDTHESGSNLLCAVASKPIKQGEELFITYLGKEQLELPYAERQELLKDWTGGECQCRRCCQERASMEADTELLVRGDNDADDDTFVQSLNRYVTAEALVDSHPAMQALTRSRSTWESRTLPFDWEWGVPTPGSPLRRKRD